MNGSHEDYINPQNTQADWDSLQQRPNASPEEKKTEDEGEDGYVKVGAALLKSAKQNELFRPYKFSKEQIPDKMDYTESNRQIFEQFKAPKIMRESYEALIVEYPGLKNISLENYSESNACYARGVRNGKYSERIRYNLGHREIYHTPDFKKMREQISSELGVDPQEIENHPDVMDTFILLHEFGHAVDFHLNFLNPEYEKIPKEQRDRKAYADALSVATSHDQDARNIEMAENMILANKNIDSADFNDLSEIFLSRIKNTDVRNRDECVLRQGDGYRKARSESYADSFAANFIKQHPELFSVKNNPEGLRIRLNEMREISEDEAIYNNFFAGNAVTITAPEQAKGSTVVLKKTLRKGEKVELSLSGDPTDKTPKGSSTSPTALDKLYSKNIRTEDGKYRTEHYFTLKDKDGFYRIEQSPHDIPEIEVTLDEFFSRYKIESGSPIAAILRDAKNKFENKNDDQDHLRNGLLVYGTLREPPEEIDKRTGFRLETIKESGITGARVPYIKRIYRKWKTYYIESANGGVIELLPLNKKNK